MTSLSPVPAAALSMSDSKRFIVLGLVGFILVPKHGALTLLGLDRVLLALLRPLAGAGAALPDGHAFAARLVSDESAYESWPYSSAKIPPGESSFV